MFIYYLNVSCNMLVCGFFLIIYWFIFEVHYISVQTNLSTVIQINKFKPNSLENKAYYYYHGFCFIKHDLINNKIYLFLNFIGNINKTIDDIKLINNPEYEKKKLWKYDLGIGSSTCVFTYNMCFFRLLWSLPSREL